MKITIGHLYPDLLNLYGDRGNIQCLMKRCLWRGIEAETIAYELDDRIDFSKLDIVLLGGGSDREQMLVCEKLKEIQKDFKAYVEDNGVVIAICGGDQLLGNYNGICIMSLGFMMSRCLSGIGVITFPKARTDGTVAEFSRNASEIAVRNVLITMFVILAALMIWVDPVLGVLAAVSALLVFWWYHHMALKYFGGTTGDLSGFFLCICEVVMALVLALGGTFNL